MTDQPEQSLPDNVLELRDDVVVSGLVDGRRHRSRTGHWSIHRSPSPHATSTIVSGDPGAAQHVLRCLGMVRRPQHVVWSLSTAQQVAWGVAGPLLGGEASKTMDQ